MKTKSSSEPAVKADLSVLERFRQTEDAARRQAEALDRDMRAKVEEAKKTLAGIQTELGRARGRLGGLTTAFERLEKETMDEVRAAQAAAAVQGEDETGDAFLRRKLSAKAAAGEAREAVDAKLADALAEVRKAAKDILELECRELAELDGIAFASMFPALNELTRLRQHVKDLESAVGGPLGGSSYARAALDQRREELAVANGRSLAAGYTWRDLSWEALRKIRFDPKFPAAYLRKLGRIIDETATLEPDMIIHLTFASGGFGMNKGLDYWTEERPREKKRAR